MVGSGHLENTTMINRFKAKHFQRDNTIFEDKDSNEVELKNCRVVQNIMTIVFQR